MEMTMRNEQLQGRRQSVDTWLPPAPPNFCDNVVGGHLEKQMQGAVTLPADTTAALEKPVDEFHLEKDESIREGK